MAVPFCVVTLDNHLVGALRRARKQLAAEGLDLDLRVHVAADCDQPGETERLERDLAESPLVLVTQLFLQEQVDRVKPLLERNDAHHDARVCLMCHGDLAALTRMGRFKPGEKQGRWSPASLMQRLRGGRGSGDSGEKQLRSLKRARGFLRFIPGSAQDVRVYLMALQAWLSGSESNLIELMRTVALRYAGPRFTGLEAGAMPELEEYPETGLYHPDLPAPGIVEDTKSLPHSAAPKGPTVGVIVMRSYVLAGNTAHYDAVIRALEARGLRVRAAFSAGLDARPVVERWFRNADGTPAIDALLSLSGFSLVGGPAWHDAEAARQVLGDLDVPFVVAQPLEFQTLDSWQADPRGLTPIETALMVAMPELDGAINPTVFGGRGGSATSDTPDATPLPERIEHLAERIAAWIRLRHTPKADRKVGVVLFNFPPNAGNAGTAAYLDVFPSLWSVLKRLSDEGYNVDLPSSPDALRETLVGDLARRTGTQARVHARIRADDHVAREPWLEEIENAWGPAPGRQLSDGANVLVLGAQFGNVFIGLQPGAGYEGDPMRLLFEKGFAPTHAFSAFYRWIREDFGAHAFVHFGTHGATEFLPGKQVGLGPECWPDRLLGDTPNVYLYAANNPSEGTLAKRRGNATLVSYLTPTLARAGLYRDLLELKEDLDRWSRSPDEAVLETIRTRAGLLELKGAEAGDDPSREVARLREQLLELEYALIPTGLHQLGRIMDTGSRAEIMAAAAEAGFPDRDLAPFIELASTSRMPARERLEATVQAILQRDSAAAAKHLAAEGLDGSAARELAAALLDLDQRLEGNPELDAVVQALDAGYIAPAPGGDVIRNPAVLPTGRNTYGFDPWRVPTPAAMIEGRAQADRLVQRLHDELGHWPVSIGLALWGTDNMKRDGAPLAQALALLGAEPQFDSYGRLSGARLLSLEELGRPRVDVVVTASGVFRDLMPLQTRLLADAAFQAASADEPADLNPVRAHALEQMQAMSCSLEEAAARVFSNADGAYGANVNLTIEGGAWQGTDELADVFVARKGYAYGRDGRPFAAHGLMRAALSTVEAAYQNLDSVELGVSDVDQYVDALGGLAKAASRESGRAVGAFIGDETRGAGVVRSLAEQVSLEARTRTLNPRWYEAMLSHGYQGVRELEARVTTTLGWSATADAVAPWVYQGIGETFVLDEEMRRRLAALNPDAAARMAGRLVEACDRGFWSPDPDTLAALQDAADELEDRLEGIDPEAAA